MQNTRLSTNYWIRNGLWMFKKRPGPMILGGMILACFYIGFSLLAHLPFGKYILIGVELSLFPPLIVGWWYLCLRLVRGDCANVSEIFNGFRCFWKAWSTFMLLVLITLVGLFLLVIPGIVWLLTYQFALFAVMEKGIATHKALNYSRKITKNHRSKLFVLLLLGFIVTLLTWPFGAGLEKMGSDTSVLRLVATLILYLVGFCLVTPCLTVALATAYDKLAEAYK